MRGGRAVSLFARTDEQRSAGELLRLTREIGMLDPESHTEIPSVPPVYVDFSTLPTTSVGAIHFGDEGPLCARQGWAVFPQERDGRKPGVVDGQMLRWSKYQVVGPDVATVERWSRQAYGLNVAAIMGEAGGLCFALDIDVTDVDLSEDIQLAAARTLGETKFQRIGNWPKIALIYRVASRDELPGNHSLILMREDLAGPSEHAVEFQGQGKAITIHGRHHKTGERFVWPTGKMPLNTPPMFAPVVTTEQLTAFVEAVRAIRPIHAKAGGGSGPEGLEFVETNGVRKPRMASAGGADWTLQDGFVVDGRERYLTRLCFETVRGNPLLAREASGVAQLKKSVLEAFRETARLDGRWKTAHLARSVAEKVGRNARQLVAGEIGPSKQAIRKPATPATEAQKAAVAIQPPEGERIAAEMVDRMDGFWADVDAYDPDGDSLPPFHVLKSPVGTGKTTAAIAAVVRRKSAGIVGTVGILLPSHDNVDEVAAKARAAGLVVETHRGQAHPDGGCEMRDKVAILHEAGISAARLCHSKVDGQDVYCPHHPDAGGSCERIAQLARMLDADLVLSVHAYATQPPPQPFKDFSAIIVDEDLGGSLIRTAVLDRKVLREKRRDIRPTKAEAQAQWGDRTPTEDDLRDFDRAFSEKRYHLVELCEEAWDAGRDPAAEIARDPVRKDQMEAAIVITGRAGRIAADVTPLTTVPQAVEYAKQLTGRQIGLEGRLWRLLTERVAAIEGSQEAGGRPVRLLDDRIWPFKDAARSLQVSWSADYSLAEKPTLFMDASANPGLLARQLGREPSEVVCRPVVANLRLNVVMFDNGTFSKRRFVPSPKASAKAKTDAQDLLKGVRGFVSKAAAVHGDGGVLVVAPTEVESLLTTDWEPPANVDTLHFGHVAGFDWAKNHRAAVLVGALYPDVTTIDGLVAAMTYRDAVATPRMDPDGTGTAEKPFDIVEESIPLRDGTHHAASRLEYRSAMANALLTQIRDEQLMQALGRLRAIYREDVPTLYVLGNVLPRGIVVDRVTTLQREDDDLGRLLALSSGPEGRIRRSSAEIWAMTAQFVRFAVRIDADPAFAASFHCVTAPSGEREWMPGYVSLRLAEARALECDGTLVPAQVKPFGRPAHARKRKSLPKVVMDYIELMEQRRLVAAVPVRTRLKIEEEHGAGAAAELIRIARVADEAWQAHVTALREKHKWWPQDEDPFQNISLEALEIPTDWENIIPIR